MIVFHFGRTIKNVFFSFSPILKFKVLEESMIPSLYPGDLVLVERMSRNFKKGDIVVIEKDGKRLIKKVQKVSGGKYFMIGENQKKSIDSRNFGLISKKDIIGKVFHKIR